MFAETQGGTSGGRSRLHCKIRNIDLDAQLIVLFWLLVRLANGRTHFKTVVRLGLGKRGPFFFLGFLLGQPQYFLFVSYDVTSALRQILEPVEGRVNVPPHRNLTKTIPNIFGVSISVASPMPKATRNKESISTDGTGNSPLVFVARSSS